MTPKLYYGPHQVGVAQGFVEGGENSMVPTVQYSNIIYNIYNIYTVLCGPHLVEVMKGFVETGEHTLLKWSL